MPQSDQYANRHYEHHYLGEVIVRLDYVSPIEFFDSALPNSIVKPVIRVFGIPEPKQKQISALGEETAWTFRSRQGGKKLVMSTHHLHFDYNTYSSFEALKEEVTPIIEATYQAAPEMYGRRFGLRYINKIDASNPDPTNWANDLKEPLISFFGILPQYKPNLAQAYHKFVWNFDDSLLTLAFGLPNKDFPAAMKEGKYLLDIDASIEGALEKNEVLASLDLFHGRIQEAFEGCITDYLRTRMGVRNGEGAR